MANRVLINKQILQDSIDAIRAKKGTTDSIVVADMPTEIASIEGGGSGIADSTKTLVGAISGVTPTDETTLNNAIAKAYADTPSEQKWNGTRSTAEGGTIKDGVAFVESIKGSTMKVQQIENTPLSKYKMSDGSTIVADGDAYKVTIKDGTSGLAYIYRQSGIATIANHKYIHIVEVKSNGTLQLRTTITGSTLSDTYTASSWGKVASIGSITANGTLNYWSTQCVNASGGAVFYFRNIMVFDLTAMGMESITTANEFAQAMGYADLQSMPFIANTNGTKLLNFTHNSISSKTRWIPVDMGTIVWKKTTRDNTGTYFEPTTFRVSPVNAEIRCDFYEVYDGNTLYTGSSLDKGIANLTNWGTIIVRDSAYTDATAFKNAMLGKYFYYQADEATQNLDTLSLNVPSSVFPNGMNGVGTAYDEWKPSEGKAIKRIGKIVINGTSDIKQETGSTGNGVGLFTLRVADSTTIANPNIGAICAKLPSISQGSLYSASLPIGINLWTWGKMLAFRISSDITSVADAKTWLSSNPLEVYYILGADAETTTDKAKAFYKVANGGAETISGGTDSTPIKADIGYRGMSAEELVTAINI